MDRLKLVAFDTQDLEIISAHLQDAVGRIADIAYRPSEKRLAIVLNRFDWTEAHRSARPRRYARHQCALRFERVLAAQLQNIELSAKTAVFSLLAIQFEPGMSPGGFVTLIFAGGGAIRLEVECIEAELRDLGAAWHTRSKPEHALEDGPDEY